MSELVHVGATLFAGIGLFFIGVRLLANNLRQLTGPTARALVGRATCNPRTAALFGLGAGAVMQSINAVIFILISLVSTGVMEARRAHVVINYANLGTSMLVLLAVLNLHLMVLILVGMTGLAFYFGLDRSQRFGYLVGALLGIGLLFLGVDFIKLGAEPLKDYPWILDFVRTYSAQSLLFAFAIGLGFTLLTHSAATFTVITMTMAAVGVLDLDSSIMLVIGAGFGSGVSTLLMTLHFTGLARQLAFYQMALKSLGALTMLLLFFVEQHTPIPLLQGLLTSVTDNIALQIALTYILFQIVSDLAMHGVHHRVTHLIEDLAPPTVEERLGKPRYLYEEGLDEATSALVLVDREQNLLLSQLPDYLNRLRSDGPDDDTDVESLFRANSMVAAECARFLAPLMDSRQGHENFQQAVALKARNDLIIALQETLHQLVTEGLHGLQTHDCAEATALRHGLAESLHLLMFTLHDAATRQDPDELELLRLLTHDRSEVMEGIRMRLLDSSPATQHHAYAATSLFERAVWLTGRYVLQLRPLALPAAADHCPNGAD